jgi:hypothetical protein
MAEIIGGIGVLIPPWRRTATAILVVLMIGALSTHAAHAEFPRLIPPLVLGGLACLCCTPRDFGPEGSSCRRDWRVRSRGLAAIEFQGQHNIRAARITFPGD